MSLGLSEIDRLLEDQIDPIANACDADSGALAVALEVLVKNGLMALRRPAQFGGPEWSDSDFRQFQVLVASHSGALAFLQTQHQSAVSLLSKSENEHVASDILPHVHLATHLIGIGFSQLRRPGTPLLRAELTDGGAIFDGHLPWATGLGFFPLLLVAGQNAAGEAIFALIPFSDGTGVIFSTPMELAAMSAARTVTAEFANYFVPEERIAFIKPRGWIEKNDTINVTLQGFFAIGCARAALKLMQSANEKKQLEAISIAIETFSKELAECERALVDHQSYDTETNDLRHDIRAWTIALMGRMVHAAIISNSGAAVNVHHAAQRAYREAMVYSVSAQTTAILSASLTRLAR